MKKDMSFGYDDDPVSQEEEKTVEQQGEHGWKKMKERVQMKCKRVVGKWNTLKSLLGNSQK